MIEEHKNLAEKFVKKGFWLYLFSYIIAPMGYIIKIIISQELSISEVGILYGLISLITMISAFNDLGMTESINHFIPQYLIQKRYDKVKTILTYAFIMQMATGIIITLLFFFGAEILGNYYLKSEGVEKIIKIFALYFLGINIFEVIGTFFMSIQNTFYNKIMDFFRILFTLVFVIIIYTLDLGNIVTYSLSWIFGLYIGILIATILFYTKYYKKYLRDESLIWSKEMFYPIFKYAILVFLGAQIGTLLSQIDMQMILLMLGTKEAGYYTNYLSIIAIPFMIIGPIFSLLFPIFSELHSKKEYDKISIIKNTLNKNFLSIGIAFNVLFFVFAEKIAFILFGEKYIMSGTIMKYSVLFLVFNYMLQINFNIMAGIGKVKERIYIIIVTIFINIIMNYILIKNMGVVGSSLATGIGWIIIWGLSELYLRKKFTTKFDLLFLTKNVFLVCIIGYIIHLYFIPLLLSYGRITSFLYIGIISIFYFFIIYFFNKKEYNTFIKQIIKKKYS